MSVLFRIADATRTRVEQQRAQYPEPLLRALIADNAPAHDFAAAFRGPQINVIAEIKYASPSKGPLAMGLQSPEKIAASYLQHGATALSILTEPKWFQGETHYLQDVRSQFPDARLLMKDFVLDPYQLLQARAAGADAVLLMVSLLGEQVGDYLAQAQELGLTALVEVHDLPELEVALAAKAPLIGVNNRDLRTLEISLETSVQLAPHFPDGVVRISESGLQTRADLERLHALGYHGFLIGSHFMASGDPGPALGKLLREAS